MKQIIIDIKVTAYLQDGAGRVGKMIFARQGRKFDYDLKQVILFSLVIYSIISSHHKFYNFMNVL